MSFLKSINHTLILAVVLVGLLGYQFMSAQTWTAPVGTAPNANVNAPVNVSAAYQAKVGDLGAVRMRAGAYCDAAGNNCLQSSNIVARNCPAGQSVTGFTATGALVCGSLAQPPPVQPPPAQTTYSWSMGGWGACAGACGTTGTQTRSVTCRSSAGSTVGDGSCSGAKPSTSQSCQTGACATVWLVNNQHSQTQCTSLGGSMVIEGGQRLCRFNQAGCPTGWALYQQWSTYVPGYVSIDSSAGGENCTVSGTCNVSRAWGNAAAPTAHIMGCGKILTCSPPRSQTGCY